MLTASNIMAKLNECCEKMYEYLLRRRLYEAGLYSRIMVKNTVKKAKQYQKAPVVQDTQRLEQWNKIPLD